MSDLTVGKWIYGGVGLACLPKTFDREAVRVRSVVALLDAAASMMQHDSGTGYLNQFSEEVCDERAVLLLALRTVGGLRRLPARELTAKQAEAGLWLLSGELDWPVWGAGSDLEVLENLGLGGTVGDLAVWLERCGVELLPDWVSQWGERLRSRAEFDYFAA